jgi:alpha/beta superfamily hydrolase
MKPDTQRFSIAGPAGALACAADAPAGEAVGTAVLCHPHPQFGGTLDN